MSIVLPQEEHRSSRHSRAGAVPENLPLQRRPFRLGALNLWQLLVVEVVLVAIAVAVVWRGVVPGLIVAVVGGLLVFVVLGRHRNRWSVEWPLLRWRLNRRMRAQAPENTDARIAALALLAPGLAVGGRESSDGVPVGIGGDQSGWFAALECTGSQEHLARSLPGAPLDRLAQLVAEFDIPGVCLQVLTHTVPAAVPRPRVEALGIPDLGPVPAQSTTWVVVRLDAHTLAEHATSVEVSPTDVLLTLVRRIEAMLRRGTRVPWRVLDTEGLVAALARSCALDGTVEPVEQEDQVICDRLAHATLWVRSWPAAGTPRVLLDALSLVPAAFTSVSMVIEPDVVNVRLRCLFRITAEPHDLATAVETAMHVADRLGAGLERLDAEQGPGVYASAPTGGGLG